MGVREKLSATVDAIRSTASEKLDPTAQFQRFSQGIGKLKHGEFVNDIFNDEILDQHAEMRQTYRMMLNHIKARRAVEMKAQLMLGNNLSVETDDDATKEYFDEQVIPDLRGPLQTAATNAVMTGNGHAEVKRGEQTGVPKGFEEMTRPHKVYNVYEDGSGFEIEGYVQEAFKKNVSGTDFETYTVLAGEQRHRQVTGTKFPADNVIHLQVGSSPMPGYGRSIWCSGIDDYKVYRELMRAQALIARHKSTPRKAFVFNSRDDNPAIDQPGATDPGNVKQQREAKLDSMRPDENPVFHNLELDIQDYSYDAKRQQIQGVMNELNKNMTSGAPSFVTDPGETNRATAAEERPMFQMEVASTRERWRQQIDPILQEMAEAKGLDDSVRISFGEFDFPTRDQKIDEILTLWNDGLLTMQQVADKLPVEFDVDPDVGDAYEWELDRGDDPFADLQQKIDDVQGADRETIETVIDEFDE